MKLGQICNRLKQIILYVIALIRRGFCCFSRRRKLSLSESDTLESINIIEYTSTMNGHDMEWNSWSEGPKTVQEHIESYRSNLVKPPNDEIPDIDYFEDMTPSIKPQPKLYIEQDNLPSNFSRLEAQTDIPIAIVPDLADWVDEDKSGWEELDNETTNNLIREKRKEIRAQKQYRLRDDQKSHSQNFAEKLFIKQS